MPYFSRFTVFLLGLVVLFSVAVASSPVSAASAAKIEKRVNQALRTFHEEVRSGDELMAQAKGVLIFPKVYKAGIGIGGEYGEGALRIKGKTVSYYSTAAASIGFQLGAQSKIVIIMFMSNNALENFRRSDGWEIGVDGSVALVDVGVGGSIDTTNLKKPVIGFIIGQKGLMYNLTLEGSKITKLDKK
ncbi:MAG TPA: hypothetical protein ENH32_08385 [Proteobacteria bacterium]|nr:hypothetical protein BMS3Abin14_02032 [bacterium BMS3Abin14]HDL53977.1 hypothetical protein [Pseudomonadota bacterium]